MVADAISSYHNFLNIAEGLEDEDSTAWTDTRLQDALTELRSNPKSEELQNRVIALAVEFNRLELAISLLQKRLLNTQVWDTEEVRKLVTYYGWAGRIDQAWSYLENLWNTQQDESVITLKDMMVQQYGNPGREFQQRWLQRELKLNPQNGQVLQQLVMSNQGPENWPQAKTYIQELLKQNPSSDTLYHYGIQRSLWYSQPDSAVNWLNRLPEEAHDQLKPLADQIAGLYAYSQGNYEQALIWAERTKSITAETKLQWLLQANGKSSFGKGLLNR
ncbi:MAG: hypothetical protein U5K69_20680 [Balneolaceae bacterium]|nr:hypothetical protein [Balneolaceae bacterium]